MDIVEPITVMGMLCGTFGVNVGHELGHRKNKFAQTLAKTYLISRLYMHFFIEYSKEHHKNVSTPNNLNSARYNEWLYSFYFRTILFSYLSAWHIANNKMLRNHIFQEAFVGFTFLIFMECITVYFFALHLWEYSC